VQQPGLQTGRQTNVAFNPLEVSFLAFFTACFILVSVLLTQQISQQQSQSDSQVVQAFAKLDEYTTPLGLSTPVEWNNQIYHVVNSKQLSIGSKIGEALVFGRQVQIYTVKGTASSREVAVMWGAYFYLAQA
jgi:hypothetical protein